MDSVMATRINGFKTGLDRLMEGKGNLHIQCSKPLNSNAMRQHLEKALATMSCLLPAQGQLFGCCMKQNAGLNSASVWSSRVLLMFSLKLRRSLDDMKKLIFLLREGIAWPIYYKEPDATCFKNSKMATVNQQFPMLAALYVLKESSTPQFSRINSQ